MTLSRNAPKDGAEYYGPFGGRYQTREIIAAIRQTLLLPDCARKFPRDIGKDRPCLKYQMGSCAGWCLEGLTQEDYRARVDQAALILQGKSEELIAQLRERMEQAAEELRFEQAAALRDRIRSVEALSHKQRVISTAFSDTDAIGFQRGAKSCFTVLHFQNGDLTGKDAEMLDEPVEEDGEAISKLVRQYYASRGTVPKHILLPAECDDSEELETYPQTRRAYAARRKRPAQRARGDPAPHDAGPAPQQNARVAAEGAGPGGLSEEDRGL